MSLLKYRDQAWIANSICSLTKLLYSITKHSLSISLNWRRIILKTSIDFLAASSHWVDTLRLSVTITPKSLSSVEADSLYVVLFCCIEKSVVVTNVEDLALLRIEAKEPCTC